MLRVESEGLRELRRDLKRVDTDKALREELKEGHEKVADIAGDRIRALLSASGRRSASRAAGAVLPSRRQDAPTLLFDGRKWPGVHGELWGAVHGRARKGPSGRTFVGYNQFPERMRPGIPYRAVDDESRKIVDAYADIIENIVKGRGI